MYKLWIYALCSVVVRASASFFSPIKVPFIGTKQNKSVIQPPTVGSNGVTEIAKTHTLAANLFNTFGTLNLNPFNEHIRQTVLSPFYAMLPQQDVCYDILGCFALTSPWKTVFRPIGAPMNPLTINSSVTFYSREPSVRPITRYLYPEVNLKDIPFNPSKTTVIITHGFASSGNAKWVHNLKNAYLSVKDVNVFALDWGEGAQRKSYLKVAGNTRVVGKLLALLIKKLIRDYNATSEKFHLIGHSLGAHISSYAAKEVPGIGRLTALDPAQPGFEGFHKEVRLDKSDAEFVEVYHTDARPFIPTMGFGMIRPHGHVDFYFNGGFIQPGCLLPNINFQVTSLKSLGKFPVELLAEIVSCPHTRAYEYFTESLDIRCTFWGQKMHILQSLGITANVFTQGYLHLPRFIKCSPFTCIPVGLSAIDSPLKGSFVVFTENSPPYCRH